MRKVISITLCLLLVLSVFSGCGPTNQPGESTAPSTEAPKPHTLQVGYGRVDITPEYSVPLSGRHEEVFSDKVVDRLYATCIAFTDENDNTVLLYELDLLQSYGEANNARLKIAKKTGVNGLQILMCSTHNHSGPNLNNVNNGNIQRYVETLPDLLVQAAVDAMADRKPVTKLYTAKTNPEGLNFLRHHILDDGSKTGWASPAVSSGVDHLFQCDNELQLIKIVREGGKDVVLMNWQGHPNAAADPNKLAIASDVDIVRKAMEAQLDCKFAYFLGASGNVNSSSYVKSENTAPDYIKDYVTRGNKLAEYAIGALQNPTEVAIGKMGFTETKYAGTAIGGSNKIDIQLYAFSIGDIGFTTAPYEMFTENGQTIKKDSPFAMTFVSTCSGGSLGYLPSEYAFDYDCYEVSITKFEKGTAEAVVKEHVAILQQLYDAAK